MADRPQPRRWFRLNRVVRLSAAGLSAHSAEGKVGMVARRLWIIFYSSLMLLALALSLLGGFLEIDREMQRDPARVLELWIGPFNFA